MRSASRLGAALVGGLFLFGIDASATNRRLIVKATAYCPCSRCCGRFAGGNTAGGVTPVEGWTVAADPDVFPIGTIVETPWGQRMVQDVGGAIRGAHLDFYYDNHRRARRHGVRYVEITVLHIGGR